MWPEHGGLTAAKDPHNLQQQAQWQSMSTTDVRRATVLIQQNQMLTAKAMEQRVLANFTVVLTVGLTMLTNGISMPLVAAGYGQLTIFLM